MYIEELFCLYRKHFRDVLKQQMADQDKQKKHQFKEKAKESEMALAQDCSDRENDRDTFMKKHLYLQTFRDSNKSVSFLFRHLL